PEGAVEGSEPPPEFALVDSALQPLLTTRQDSAQAQSEYQTGSQSPRAMYFTKLRRLPLPDPADPLAAVPGITRLVITVESPASAPEGRRKVHRYVTLVPSS
ncbi:MAG TPA: hypothetical protein PK490_20725, partial [Prosthecobacter sp.]|nr:hypothetical protein [Prosthecobacter sp.]